MMDSEKMDHILSGIQDMKSEMQELQRRMTDIDLTLKNETNHNIQYIS